MHLTHKHADPPHRHALTQTTLFSDAESEWCAQENINKYVQERFGYTSISNADRKKFASELVLRTDYERVTETNKGLLRDNRELQNEYNEEKENHLSTEHQLKDRIEHFNALLDEKQNLEIEFKKNAKKIEKLQQENMALRTELRSWRQNMVQPLPPRPEESDDETEEEYAMDQSQTIENLQAQIEELKTENINVKSKILSILSTTPANPCENNSMSCLECLDHLLGYFTEVSSKQKEDKQNRNVPKKHQQAYKQIQVMRREMDMIQKQQEERQKEHKKQLREAKKREARLQKKFDMYKKDMQDLQLKVNEMNTKELTDSSIQSTVPSLPQIDTKLTRLTVQSGRLRPGRCTDLRHYPASAAATRLPVVPSVKCSKLHVYSAR